MNPFTHSLKNSPSLILRSLSGRLGLTVFAGCLVLGVLLVGWRARLRMHTTRVQVQAETRAQALALEAQFAQAISAVEVLGALATYAGGQVPQFDSTAARLLAAHPALASLELQPGGVVTEVAPPSARARSMGRNTFADPAQRADAYAAMKSRRLTASGPLRLPDGQLGVVVRLPIFQRAAGGRIAFWGFVAASVRLSEVLARARLTDLAQQDRAYAFYAPRPAPHQPVVVVAHGRSGFRHAVQWPVRAHNVQFRLAVQPRAGWFPVGNLVLELLIAVFFALLAGALANALRNTQSSAAAFTELRSRLDGVADQQAAAQEELRLANESAAAAQVKLAQSEQALQQSQQRLEDTERRAQAAESAYAEKLRQAEASLRDWQARIAQAERSGKDELTTVQAQLAQAKKQVHELQARLEAAQTSARQTEDQNATRLNQAEQTIAELQSRLEATKETSAASRQSDPAKVTAAPSTEEQAEPTPVPAARAQPKAKRARSKKKREDDQLNLFGDASAEIEAAETSPTPTATAADVSSDQPQPNAATVTDAPEPAGADGHSEVAMPDQSARPIPEESPPAGVADVAPAEVAKSHPSADAAVPDLHLPEIEGLDLAEGLAQVDRDPKLYRKSLQHFVDQQAKAPDKIRDLLVRGDSLGAQRVTLALKRAAGTIGAPAIHAAAAQLERVIQQQADPTEIEQFWDRLAQPLGSLLTDLRSALKPKSETVAPARPLPPAPPLVPAELRTAVRQILPLLADQDPGALDCLKDNRDTFRSAFSPSAFVEFEQHVRAEDYATALEQLKKAVRKHGLLT